MYLVSLRQLYINKETYYDQNNWSKVRKSEHFRTILRFWTPYVHFREIKSLHHHSFQGGRVLLTQLYRSFNLIFPKVQKYSGIRVWGRPYNLELYWVVWESWDLNSNREQKINPSKRDDVRIKELQHLVQSCRVSRFTTCIHRRYFYTVSLYKSTDTPRINWLSVLRRGDLGDGVSRTPVCRTSNEGRLLIRIILMILRRTFLKRLPVETDVLKDN